MHDSSQIVRPQNCSVLFVHSIPSGFTYGVNVVEGDFNQGVGERGVEAGDEGEVDVVSDFALDRVGDVGVSNAAWGFPVPAIDCRLP